MISVGATWNRAATAFGAIADRLKDVFGKGPVSQKLYSLGGDLEQLLHVENARALMMGLDKDDDPMVITKRQLDPELSARLGSGPPLAPHYGASRVVTMFRTQITAQDGMVNIDGSWPGAPFLRFHVDSGMPRTLLPIRDIVGLRPSTRALIERKVAMFTADFHL